MLSFHTDRLVVALLPLQVVDLGELEIRGIDLDTTEKIYQQMIPLH